MDIMRIAGLDSVTTAFNGSQKLLRWIVSVLLLKSAMDFTGGVAAFGEVGDTFHILPVMMALYILVAGYGFGVPLAMLISWKEVALWNILFCAFVLLGSHLAITLSVTLHHCSCITFREAVSNIRDWSGLIWAAVSLGVVLLFLLCQLFHFKSSDNSNTSQ